VASPLELRTTLGTTPPNEDKANACDSTACVYRQKRDAGDSRTDITRRDSRVKGTKERAARPVILFIGDRSFGWLAKRARGTKERAARLAYFWWSKPKASSPLHIILGEGTKNDDLSKSEPYYRGQSYVKARAHQS
jgi:hypothetical protein